MTEQTDPSDVAVLDPDDQDDAPQTQAPNPETPQPEDEVQQPSKRNAPAKKAAAKRGRAPARTTRPTVRRIAAKAEEITGADEQTRVLAAELTGAPSVGVADLTTTIMEAKKSPIEAAIADLTVIQAGSVPEAVVHLVGMSKPELQALTQLVAAFSDQALPEKIPAKSADAALELVDPVRSAEIDDGALERLVALLTK